MSEKTNLSLYIRYCNDRELARINKEAGMSPPWTDDPIIRNWFFCNVFREDDVHTRMIAPSFRKEGHPDRVAWLVWSRWLSRSNLREAVEKFAGKPFRPEEVQKWMDEKYNRGEQVFHGAYMLSAEKGVPKTKTCVRIATEVGAVVGGKDKKWDCPSQMWREATAAVKGFGGLLAYELVTDLTHTRTFSHPWERWAHLGPGAKKGLREVFPERDIKAKDEIPFCMEVLDRVSASAGMRGGWAFPKRKWTPREAEHNLCEFGKYRRIARGERGKRTYSPPQKKGNQHGLFYP